jgi:hypothetical protein
MIIHFKINKTEGPSNTFVKPKVSVGKPNGIIIEGGGRSGQKEYSKQ